MNCPMNVVSYAQIRSIFQARPANAHARSWVLGFYHKQAFCSDAMTLPISDWLFRLEGGTIPPYCVLQFLPFISIGVNRLCIYIDFGTRDFIQKHYQPQTF